MKLEYDRGMYPPRVKVDAQSENSEQRIEIMVSNVSKRKLNVDFTLRPGMPLYMLYKV